MKDDNKDFPAKVDQGNTYDVWSSWPSIMGFSSSEGLAENQRQGEDNRDNGQPCLQPEEVRLSVTKLPIDKRRTREEKERKGRGEGEAEQ